MADSPFVELYAALHELQDTLPDAPAANPTPQRPDRTPTAMPGLAVKEPDPTRGWKLAEGRTFDESVVARMRQRAKQKGYHLDVKPMKFADGRTQHHITVYHPKGQRMENPTEFYGADEGEAAESDQPAPIVAYHGSKSKISEFDPAMIGQTDRGMYGHGFSFTTDPKGARIYGPHVHEAELNIKNPVKIGPLWGEEKHADTMWRFLRDHLGEQAANTLPQSEWPKAMQQLGHDGVAVKDHHQIEYLAFHPHQIKIRGIQSDPDGEPDQYAARHIPSSPGQRGLSFDGGPHDVSDEPRDASGEWTAGAGPSVSGAPETREPDRGPVASVEAEPAGNVPAPAPGTTAPSAGGRPTGETLTGPGGGDLVIEPETDPNRTWAGRYRVGKHNFASKQEANRYIKRSGELRQLGQGLDLRTWVDLTPADQRIWAEHHIPGFVDLPLADQAKQLKEVSTKLTVENSQRMNTRPDGTPKTVFDHWAESSKEWDKASHVARHTALSSALLREYYAQRFADRVVERYAEQQSRLFDDAGGQPRKGFDETKHQRAGGQFARKFPRVQSKEVQPALPGVDLPAQRRIVTKPQPVGLNAPAAKPTRSLAAASKYLTDNWRTWWGGLDTPVPEPGDMEKEFAQHAGPTVTRQEANQILRNAGVGKHLPPETDLLAGTKSFQKHGDAIPSDHLLFHAVHAMMDQDRTNRRLAATEQAGDAKAMKFAKPGTPVHFVVHPAAHADYQGQWQITRFDDRGPSGHQYHKTKEEAIGSAIGAHPHPMWDEGDSDYRLVEQYTLDRAKSDLYAALWDATLDRYAERENQDYAGEHSAPMRDTGAPAHDLTANGIYPQDVYSHHAVRYYGDGSEHDQYSFRVAHGLRNRPDAKVKIYRAVPLSTEQTIQRHQARMKQILARGSRDPKEYEQLAAEIERLQSQPPQNPATINRGDWVTINPRYAHDHGKSALNGQYHVLSKTVPASHIFTNGDSIHEWGYDPEERAPVQTTPKRTRKKAVPATTPPTPPADPAADLYTALWCAQHGLDRYAVKPDPRQTSLFDRPVTVQTTPQTQGLDVSPSLNRPSSASANTGQLPDNLSAALPPPASAILPPRQQARHQELLAKGFRRTPAEQQEFQDLGRRIEELQDRRPPVTREHYTEAPAHWQHDPTPPVDESQYIDNEEHHRKLWEFYKGKGTSSRTTPSELPNPPIGTWKMDKHFGIYGREIEQLRMVPVHELTLSEGDYTKVNDEGRGDDARRYAGWMKEHGLEHLPPIHVVETDQGTHRVMNGHRRTAAAKLAGMTHIPAWVSPRMSTGKKYYGQDLDIGTGLTYEGAHHGAEAASKMYEDRQRKLSESIRAERAAKENAPAPESYTQQLRDAILDRYHAQQPERYKYTPPPAPRFEPADPDHYVETARRSAEMRLPRQGELTEDARIQNEWTPHKAEWRRKLHKRDNVHLVDIPTHMLQISQRDLAPERKARLDQLQGTDDPVMASIDHDMTTGELSFNVDDGNNRTQWHLDHGHPTVPVFLHEHRPGDMEKARQMITAQHAKMQNRITDDTVSEPYAQFQDLVALAGELDRYKAKDSPGQRHLFKEEDHPRAPEGAKGGHGGEFVDKKESHYPVTPEVSKLRGEEDAAHREAKSKELDRPRDELQRLRADRERRKAHNKAMLPTEEQFRQALEAIQGRTMEPTHDEPAARGDNEDLVARVQAGEKTAFDQLLAKNRPFIADRARKAGARDGRDLDDWIQEGSVILWQAAEKFDAQQGNKFLTYFGTALDRRLWKLRQRDIGTKDKPKPRHLQGAVDDEGRPVHEPIASPDEIPLAEQELKQAVRTVVEKLPNPRHKQILQLAYGLDGPPLTHAQIAEQLGVRPQAVQQQLARILPTLQRALQDQYAARCLRGAMLERYHAIAGTTPDRYGLRDLAGAALTKAADWVKGNKPNEPAERKAHAKPNRPTAPTQTERRAGPAPQSTEPEPPPVTAKIPPKPRATQPGIQRGQTAHPVLSYLTPALNHVTVTAFHTPNLQAAHEALTKLHDPDQIQQEAHRIVDAKVRAQTVNIRNDQSQYRKLYSQHIDQARQAVHENLKRQADQSLAAAKKELASKQGIINQAIQDTRGFQARAQQYPEGHPARAQIMDAVKRYAGHIQRHRSQLGALQQTVEQLHAAAPEAPGPWQGWSSGEGKKPLSDEERRAREDERHEVSRARRNLDWLQRRVELPQGPSGNPARDIEHPEYRQQILGLLDQELAKHRAGSSKPKATAKQPVDQQPTDPAGWLAHVDQAVHRATAPAQQDATVRDIALRSWKADYPTLSPKGQAAFRDYLERARGPAHGQLKQAATQRLDAAEQWFTTQGLTPPPELAKQRQKLAALQAPRSNAGFADAVPVVVGPRGERKPITDASLARQEAKQQPAAPPQIRPEERQKTKAQQAREYNDQRAKEYGMTPKRYHEEASRFWQDRVERAQSLEGLRQDLASEGLTKQKVAQLENSGRDVDAVKNLDTATDKAAARGLPDMTADELFELAKRGPIEIPGPHQDGWHHEFADHLRQRGIVSASEREAAQEPEHQPEPDHGFSDQEMAEMRREAFETGESIEDLMARHREQLADSTPFSARRAPDLRSELYSALWWATTSKV